MTRFVSKQWRLGLLASGSLLALLACQLLTGSPTSAPTPVSIPPTITPAGQPQPATEAPVSSDPVFGPGTFNLPAPAVGLADLTSYRATLTITFEGTRAGQPEQWARTYLMLANREAGASQLTVDTAGDEAARIFESEINGSLYERKGSAAVCTVSVAEEGQSLADLWEPALFLLPVVGADEAGSDSLNGAAVNHYTFDERALGAANIATATGEVWVDSTAGYVVKYTLTSKGGGDYFGDEREGAATWLYELTEVNQPQALELPADCPIGLLDVPLLPDAADSLNTPGMLTYTTARPMTEAAAYYQEQLPALGWQLLEAPSITDGGIVLDFTQANQQLSVIITPGETGTTVLITAQAVEP